MVPTRPLLAGTVVMKLPRVMPETLEPYLQDIQVYDESRGRKEGIRVELSIPVSVYPHKHQHHQ